MGQPQLRRREKERPAASQSTISEMASAFEVDDAHRRPDMHLKNSPKKSELINTPCADFA